MIKRKYTKSKKEIKRILKKHYAMLNSIKEGLMKGELLVLPEDNK